MAEERTTEPDEVPWPQKVLDNLWLLLPLSIAIPGVLYLAWGLIELAVLPDWAPAPPATEPAQQTGGRMEAAGDAKPLSTLLPPRRLWWGRIGPDERLWLTVAFAIGPFEESTVAFCTVPGHREAGMEFEITVTD